MAYDENHNIDSKLIMKDLKDVMAVFAKHKVRAFFSYGALLGAVREKDFIKWDDDIDLDVIDTCSFETRKKIGHDLAFLGFKVQPIMFNVFGVMEMTAMTGDGGCAYDGDGETGIIVCERNFHFSIFFSKVEGDEYVCTPKVGSGKLISVPTHFFEKPGTVKMHGEVLICPAPIKEYLEYVYGKDWKTPIRENKHAPQFQERHK